MAKIQLSEGSGMIAEGTHVLKVTEVQYDEDFGKLKLELQNSAGQKVFQNYGLLNKEGEPVQGAINAFSYFAKTCLNDFSLEEIDHDDLLGCYVKAKVKHEKYENNDGEEKTSVKLGDVSSATVKDFNAKTKTKAKVKVEEVEDDDDGDDLDDLLDGLDD